MKSWFEIPGRTRIQVLVLAAVIAGILGFLASRGSWYADDFEFLINGRRGFTADALLEPVNDHIVPGLRLSYALFALVDGPSWTLTVVFRAVLWFAAVCLMAGLIWRTTKTPWATLAAVVFYGLAPVSMPSFMSLSSGVNTIPAHCLGLIVLHCTLDWFAHRRWTSLLGAGAALAASMAFWEKSGLIFVTAIALVMVVVPKGERGRRPFGTWFLSMAGAAGVYAVLYIVLGSSSGSWPGIGVMGRLLWLGFVRAPVVTLVGGPAQWRTTDPPYFGLSSPHPIVIGIGLLVLIAFLVIAYRRARSTLWLWGAVLAFTVATVITVGIGRYTAFGEVLTAHYHYWTDISIPLTLAVILTLTRSGWLPKAKALRYGIPALWVGAVAISFAMFAGPWGENPSGRYLENMTTDIAADPGETNLWDTRPPLSVMPYISTERRISHVLELTGTKAVFMRSTPQPLFVDDDGHVRSAQLVPWATGVTKPECGNQIRGRDPLTIKLNEPLPEGEWAVAMSYLANPEAHVDVDLVSPDGGVTPTRSTPVWDAGLANAFAVADEPTAVEAVRLTPREDGTQVCLDQVFVGLLKAQE
ncbi:hypothetical protein [Janibacter sp. GXQ6167]|uniref:hypothetical protein n=1 Tax=Janibacter sp. GXQ6167 TaxID=3240791 RepID=UPI00352621AC